MGGAAVKTADVWGRNIVDPISQEEQESLADMLTEEYTPRDTEQNAFVLEAYRRGRNVRCPSRQ